MESEKNSTPVTLTQYIIRSQPPHSRGEFTLMMMAIQTAVKVIEKNIRRAGMLGMFGYLTNQSQNATGDSQAKLDVIANNAFKAYLMTSTCIAALGSEEEETLVIVDFDKQGDYLIFFDPLDGSSNIDANVSVGSIWGIWRVPKGKKFASIEDANQFIRTLKGNDIVSAGYAMYGSATNLVLTSGHGVDGFTLDPNIGEFLLTHPHICIPKKRRIFSVNEGNYNKWEAWYREYIEHVKKNKYTARYIGSMVGDVHRTLLYGGIFCYPRDAGKVEGKLRFLYEAAPMALIVEQAGGKALSGTGRILDQSIHRLHQRTPVYLGSRHEIDICMSFRDKHAKKQEGDKQGSKL
ncbi:fructose-1,6-bisphosphatase I [Strigomonas culicis]|uniref:fructose-bisphosphatase n=1 Tax=Strigomonas culicis TaxID=28005 RepID=S9U1S3_9TRYP|nr:fructose-1,6-bisphosphatase I [Strigomonas culicis]EPY22907.1 fructose-1,6-bisphosphatase, cytosolic [Strigomonas culicis]EPY24682.1 fructose-1,6-bisphosphatase, cytosolic [Strigomonas culicis]EPY32392.1 fructose-1,6-bisphosphatase I [Strigomonas culicis]EPY34579.1 fructose-1,6-bisphosphatase I [Strigomonas culicis]|eukprot:EPY21778.1 fructose-1,6-bisphosphatase I [Strigomonas culicis]